MKKALLAVAVCFSATVFAQANINEKYYEVTTSQTKEVSTEVLDLKTVMDMSQNCTQSISGPSLSGGPFDDVELALDQIINIGKKIWNIVVAGKPVMNYKTDIATAMPQGVKCWLDLSNWQAPISKTYSYTAKNAFGMDVVKFNYRVIFVYGGGVNGQGQYIGYATTQPVDMVVQWGFKLNAVGSVPTVFNTGSKNDPVGGMQMNMNYRIESPMTTIEQSQAYFISGKGEFKKLD